MAEKQSPGIAYVVSLCGIMCGLSLALMFCLGMIPGFEYVSPAVAGVPDMGREGTPRRAVRAGKLRRSRILTMLFTANYEASMMYIFLLGYYPIVRQYLMKLKYPVLRWVSKLALYAAAAIAAILC